MKSKKTIRRLTPLARRLAHFQRDLKSMERRMTKMIEAANDAEFELSAHRRSCEARYAAAAPPADPPADIGHTGSAPYEVLE